jgi:hypothetical protein
MGNALSWWWVRLGIVAGVTFVAYRYLPKVIPGDAGVIKTIALAVGGVSGVAIVAANVPYVANLVSGTVPTSLMPPKAAA